MTVGARGTLAVIIDEADHHQQKFPLLLRSPGDDCDVHRVTDPPSTVAHIFVYRIPGSCFL